jgi:hypothetical protein
MDDEFRNDELMSNKEILGLDGVSEILKKKSRFYLKNQDGQN